MRSSFLFVAALASCILPAIACQGDNCNIVANVTVRSGDTFAGIAGRSKVTVAQLQFVNPEIPNPRFIVAGQVIRVPDPRCVAPEPAPPLEPTATCVVGGNGTYKVVGGDTMTIIAKEKLGITVASLVGANPGINPDAISVGQVIKVPRCGVARRAATATCEPTGAFTYPAAEGDTMISVSETVGIALNALLAANPNIDSQDRLSAGALILVPGCDRKARRAAPKRGLTARSS